MFLGKPFSTMVTYVFFSTFVIVRNMRLQMKVFAVNNKTMISRSCYYEVTGARLQGCVQVEEGDSFSGELCYCNTDDCEYFAITAIH